ncbi:MAG: hypothetical protein ACP5O1_05310 [Phycisphaerae bacterium]
MRSQNNSFRTAHKAGDHSPSVSPPPYGGSDRIVFLRSLPLSSLHALLVVACTMAFFVSLAGGHSDESIFGKRGLSGPPSMVRPAGTMHVAATVTPPARTDRAGSLSSAGLQAVAGHSHAENHTSFACRAGVTVDAITGRDPNHLTIAGEIEINSCLVVLPGASARRLTRSTSDSTQVAPANFPRLC